MAQKQEKDKILNNLLIESISGDIEEGFDIGNSIQSQVKNNIIQALEDGGLKKGKKTLEHYLEQGYLIENLFSTVTAKLIFEILGGID